MVYVMHVAASQAIAASATLESRDAVLRDIATGKHLSTLALSESGSRSHFWAPMSARVPGVFQVQLSYDGRMVVSPSLAGASSRDHPDRVEVNIMNIGDPADFLMSLS